MRAAPWRRGPTACRRPTSAGAAATPSTFLWDGEEITLRAVPEVGLGAALLHYAGSRAHVAQLAERARARGLRLTPSGLLDATRPPLARRVRGRSLRRPRPAVDSAGAAARAGRDRARRARRASRRRSTVADIQGDLHTHTLWSDGRDTTEAVIRSARALGYRYLAITDHSPTSKASRTLSIEGLAQQAKEIEALRAAYPEMTILHGCEVDILPDGSLDLPDAVMAGLDIVLASLHDAAGQPPDRLLDALPRRRWPTRSISVVTHPANRTPGRANGYALDWDRFFAAARDTGTAVEVDGAPGPPRSGRPSGPAGRRNRSDGGHRQRRPFRRAARPPDADGRRHGRPRRGRGAPRPERPRPGRRPRVHRRQAAALTAREADARPTAMTSRRRRRWCSIHSAHELRPSPLPPPRPRHRDWRWPSRCGRARRPATAPQARPGSGPRPADPPRRWPRACRPATTRSRTSPPTSPRPTKAACCAARPPSRARCWSRSRARMRWEYKTPEEKLFVVGRPQDLRLGAGRPAGHGQRAAGRRRPGDADPVPRSAAASWRATSRRRSPARCRARPADSVALALVPKTPVPDYDRLTLVVDRATLGLRMLIARDGQGGTSTFVFSKLRENVGLPDARFAFTIPRGADVVAQELRRACAASWLPRARRCCWRRLSGCASTSSMRAGRAAERARGLRPRRRRVREGAARQARRHRRRGRRCNAPSCAPRSLPRSARAPPRRRPASSRKR